MSYPDHSRFGKDYFGFRDLVGVYVSYFLAGLFLIGLLGAIIALLTMLFSHADIPATHPAQSAAPASHVETRNPPADEAGEAVH